ncbi:MAG: hypothetical protein VYB55_00435 [Bacteroidota bacterium]|nr:hypothetical protein [Bacteroidota bacterium]
MKKVIFLFSMLILFSCKKEKQVFQVHNVNIEQNSANKNHLKSTTEFLSIAYFHIFETPIPTPRLSDLSVLHSSFGDKKLIEQMTIKNFLNDDGIQISSIDRSSIITKTTFVRETYKKLYNRIPEEYELWFILNMIEKDADLTAEIIYFSLMTADEYRYY